ncbi:hypothetical protein DFR52_10129 [Hoeflea marina]|uniref:Uncharacterized protein n=1 Tax=Hoeflea marina TaxID=274592 RepID=A0A317PQ82_9HYPH|nr:hypothetical protein DFR52_10129 [Hoeflea marina]
MRLDAAVGGLARSMRASSRLLCMASQRSLRRWAFSQKSGLLPEYARQNERGRRRHIAAVFARFVDMLPLDTHRLGQHQLGQLGRLDELRLQDLADAR